MGQIVVAAAGNYAWLYERLTSEQKKELGEQKWELGEQNLASVWWRFYRAFAKFFSFFFFLTFFLAPFKGFPCCLSSPSVHSIKMGKKDVDDGGLCKWGNGFDSARHGASSGLA